MLRTVCSSQPLASRRRYEHTKSVRRQPCKCSRYCHFPFLVTHPHSIALRTDSRQHVRRNEHSRGRAASEPFDMADTANAAQHCEWHPSEAEACKVAALVHTMSPRKTEVQQSSRSGVRPVYQEEQRGVGSGREQYPGSWMSFQDMDDANFDMSGTSGVSSYQGGSRYRTD